MRLRPCIDLHGGRVKQIVGGSIRDGEVIEAADKAGMALVFTGHRHFRH